MQEKEREHLKEERGHSDLKRERIYEKEKEREREVNATYREESNTDYTIITPIYTTTDYINTCL
jgi:hypothetical protein